MMDKRETRPFFASSSRAKWKSFSWGALWKIGFRIVMNFLLLPLWSRASIIIMLWMRTKVFFQLTYSLIPPLLLPASVIILAPFSPGMMVIIMGMQKREGVSGWWWRAKKKIKSLGCKQSVKRSWSFLLSSLMIMMLREEWWRARVYPSCRPVNDEEKSTW